jgi:hypothetical protein
MFDQISRCNSTAKAYRGMHLRRFGNIVPCVYSPVLAKHSKHLSFVDAITVGVDRMQRNFEPMRRQVEGGRQFQLTDDRAKLIVYRAFVEAELDAPKRLVRDVHDPYLRAIAGFEARTMQANPALKP